LLPDPANVTAEQITVEIPATLQAGVQGVQVIQRIPMGYADLPHTGVESNVMPFVLRPRVDAIGVMDVTGAGSDPRSATVQVDVVPDVAPSQRVRLLLNELRAATSIPDEEPPKAYSFPLPNRNPITSVPSIPAEPTGTLTFLIKDVKAAKYLVRVQVDGAESLPAIWGGRRVRRAGGGGAMSETLHARIAVLRERLAAYVDPSRPAVELPAIEEGTPLDRIRAGFGLSPFETEILVLCAGAEIDANIRALCSAINGAADEVRPTFNVALAALPEAHWTAIHPAAALRHWKMIEVRGGESLMSSALQIDERVLHYLFGVSYRDPRLAGLIVEGPAAAELLPSHESAAGEVIAAVTRTGDLAGGSVVALCGTEPAALTAIASAAAARLNLRLHVLRAGDVPAHAADRETLARLWEREAVLDGGALLIDLATASEHAAGFADGLAGVVIVAGGDPIVLARRTVVRVDVARPTPAEQRALWISALGDDAARLEQAVEQVAAQFTLPLASIRAIAAQMAEENGSAVDALWQRCRLEARVPLDTLAQRIEPAATWDDIVLPEAQLQMLHEIAAQARQRHKVYETWGFSARIRRDLGIAVLFAGASGTGKTLAAEILANELRLDLYRVDLSQMVSKWIGETEKNLARIFEAGEQGGAILLFDEADALFGRRSDVKDSHDRFANIQVSYLLQRMESYPGLAILTTNLRGALDNAFLRRLRFMVNFPFPDNEQRARIWQRVFPAGAPLGNIEVQKLARLNVAGGSIRNIALHAAFLAADEGSDIRMRHLARAAHGEYAKLEKPLTDSLGGWT
jgi:hypothetical protein